MPKESFKSEKFGDYFKLPNPGLRAYYENVKQGQPEVYRTPFYKGKSMEELVSMWTRYIQPLKHGWPSLYEYEIDQATKIGPMSVMKPLRERMPDIDAYYDSILKSQVAIPDAAINAVAREWIEDRRMGPEMQDQYTTVEKMKKSTNSGSPYWTKKRRVVRETVPCDVWPEGKLVKGKQGTDGFSKRIWKYAAVLAWRGQEGGPKPGDTKQRVVWAMPFAVNLRELQVYQPLIEYAQRNRIVPAWISNEEVDAAITRLFDTKAPEDLVICTDFTKFDQHFNSSCQDAARDILIRIFDTRSNGQNFDKWIDCVFPIKYMIPLAYDWNVIRYGHHGMASGSGGTNADETLVHRALQHEAAMRHGSKLNINSMCLGDDGVLSYPGITVKDVMQTYTAHGLDMNESKQYVSTQDCIYLRRWHHTKYRINGVCAGVYPTFRALGRLCQQERWYDPEDWGPEQVALRQLSILENCKYHPLRERFVDFCMKGDKYRLGRDIPGFFDNITTIAKESIDHMPDFLGYTRTLGHENDEDYGLSSWWIVKYLMSLGYAHGNRVSTSTDVRMTGWKSKVDGSSNLVWRNDHAPDNKD